MRLLNIFILGTIFPLMVAGGASAQKMPPTAIRPDPAHAIFVLPQNMKWKQESLGQQQAPLFGDPTKPGPYGVLIKWLPGHMSKPHFHSTDRWAYVISGTWWVSTSSHYDPKTTYPLPAGTFATDLANRVHWDGAKDEEVLLEVVGMGPATSVLVPGNK